MVHLNYSRYAEELYIFIIIDIAKIFACKQLGIFADGLASFTAGDDEAPQPEEEEVDATAGMELTLMGVQTRPLVFFVGKGELMGLVWSGAGSERNSAVNVRILNSYLPF